jgi:hypothetical protein
VTTLAARRTALYRWYDASGDLLYIGISVQPWARAGHHVITQDWAEQMAVCVVEWHQDRAAAEAAERAAIKAERPRHNKTHAVTEERPAAPVQPLPSASDESPSLQPTEARRYYLEQAGLDDQEVSVRQWYRWLDAGKVPSVVLLSGRRRVRTAELDALIQTGGVA